MSIRNTYPTIRPSLNLDFARSRTLDPRITFSRTTTGTYMDSDGLIKVASADEARFDHKYEDGNIVSLGLLVEEQRSNLITYSEDFDTWTKPGTPAGASISQDVTISPDGCNTADKIVESNTNGGHGIWKGFTLPQTTTYTFSVFLKADERTWVDVRAYNSTNGNQFIAKIDLENGDFLENTGGTVKLDPFPNGWWRFSGVCSFDNIYTQFFIAPIISNNDASDTSYTGDGSSGIYVWGAQLEVGAFPTSYIPRPDASTATREPDKVTITGDNFSDWYNQSEGTVFASFRAQSSATKYLMGISNNSASELIYIRATASGSDSAMRDGGSDVAYRPIAYSRDINTLSKHCVSYKQNDFIVSAQGQISTVDDNCTVPTPTNISIGSLYNTTHLGGTISKLSYYPKRLSNSQLQNLTK